MKNIVVAVLVIGGIALFVMGVSTIANATKEFGVDSPVIALADGMPVKHFLAGMSQTVKGMAMMLGGLAVSALGYVLGKL